MVEPLKRVVTPRKKAVNSDELPKRIIDKKNRIPLYKSKRLNIIDFSKDEAYHHHCFTDKDGKIERARKAGYAFVEAHGQQRPANAQDPSRFGNVLCQSVGLGDVGYTMRIPKEWWEEDKQVLQKRLDERDKVMGIERLPTKDRHLFKGKVKVDHILDKTE